MADGKDDAGIVDVANNSDSNDGGQQSSITVADTAKQLVALQKQVEELTRSLQSQKDKGIAKTNQRIDGLEQDLKKALRQAAERGQSAQDVLGQLEADEERETREALAEFARTFKSGQFQTAGPQGSGNASGVDVTNVLRELELDESDVRVQTFRARSFATEAEAYREAAKLVKTISTKQPSEADMPSPVGRAVSANKMEQLQQEYNNRSKNLRGQALINLKMEMRKKGLNVY